VPWSVAKTIVPVKPPVGTVTRRRSSTLSIVARAGPVWYVGRAAAVACVAWLSLPDLSSISPTGCPAVVTGVVPALSWNSVSMSDGPYHAPAMPPANSDAGSKALENTTVAPRYALLIGVLPR